MYQGIEYPGRRSGTAAAARDSPGTLRLRESGGRGLVRPALQEKPDRESTAARAVICRDCSHPITSAQKVFFVDGSQTHTFFNPAGIVFEIICFTQAPGCILQGEATSTFSWFPGFTWRIAFCGRCLTHLGWYFESGPSSFFGLIQQKLAGDL